MKPRHRRIWSTCICCGKAFVMEGADLRRPSAWPKTCSKECAVALGYRAAIHTPKPAAGRLHDIAAAPLRVRGPEFEFEPLESLP